jgi:hypothetical protein
MWEKLDLEAFDRAVLLFLVVLFGFGCDLGFVVLDLEGIEPVGERVA